MSLGFTFDGIHSSAYGVVMKSKNRQVLPAVNDAYVQIPGRQGSYLFPRELADRIIAVDCSVLKATIPLLRSSLREIAAWLYTADRKTLVFDDEPGKNYRAKLDSAINLEQAFVLGKFNLHFRCEPLAYGTEVTTNFVNDSATVTNTGSADTEPYFQTTFTATATEWKITLGTDYCRVIHAFQIGDVLIMNFATGAVLLNGARAMNLLDWQNSRFFTLVVGNNALAVTPTGKSVTLVKHTPKWL